MRFRTHHECTMREDRADLLSGAFTMRHSYLWLIALVLMVAPACNDEDSEGDPSGGDPGGDPQKPGPGDDGERPKGSAEIGDLCDQDDECASGFCVAIGSGKDEG